MADLDDFFAKKDKKKKKSSKAGFSKANTDVIAKNLEVQRHKDQEKESEQAEPLATTLGNQASHESTTKLFNPEMQGNENDDEWYDYDTEEKDYTGLKIEALDIQDELALDEEGSEINNEVSEDSAKKESGSVWSNRVNANGSDEVENDNSSHYTPAPAPPVANTAYIPPEKKKAMNSVLLKSRKSKAAPDINSQIYFPSLSSSVIPCEDDSRRDEFEEVKGGGGSSTHNHKSEAPRLALDNKFSALRE